MSYEDTLKKLSQGTVHVIGQLWALVEDGTLDRAAFPAAAADLIAVARLRGQAAAWAAFRAFLEAATGHPMAWAVLPSQADRDRLERAVTTVLASDLDTAMQLARLAANEPLTAAADAYSTAMITSRKVSGWRRGVESDACELCRWWWRDGRMFSTYVSLPRHVGCTCHQIPVLNEDTDNYQTESQATQALARRRARKETA